MKNWRNIGIVLFIIAICVVPCTTVKAKSSYVLINSKNFPDPYFRRYVVYLADKNKDMKLSSKEIAAIKKITLDTAYAEDWRMKIPLRNMKCLVGLKYFTNVEEFAINNYKVNTLYLNFPKLRRVYIICENMTKFRASGGKNLKELVLYNYKGPWDLKLKNFPDLEALTIFAERREKKLNFNEIGIDNCKKLESLCLQNFYGLKTDEMDLTANCNLEEVSLDCDVKNIDCTGLDKLKLLYIGSENLEKVEVKGCVNIERIGLSESPLSELDITGLNALTELRCGKNVKIIGANDKIKDILEKR